MRPLQIEKFLNCAWPAIEQYEHDAWKIRFSDGLTKRANSVTITPFYTLQLDDKINYCERAYKKKALPTIFKILQIDGFEVVEEALRSRYYIKKGESFVMACDLKALQLRISPEIIVENKFSEDWVENFLKAISPSSKQNVALYRKMFSNILGNVVTIRLIKKGESIAFGYAFFENQFMGLFDIFVSKKFRGYGYGREIVESLLKVGKKHANIAYLQVVKDNLKAIRLYADLGFSNVYHYWYRIKEMD